jgi:MFS family permease
MSSERPIEPPAAVAEAAPPREADRRRIVAGLFVAQSLFSAATIAAFTVTPIIATQLGGGDEAAGVPSTINLIGRAALAYPIGWLTDRLGRRLGLSAGFALGVLASLLAAWSIVQGSMAGFLAAAFLVGGARAASEQSRYSAAEIYPSARQARIIGLVVFAGTIGAIGGPLLVTPSGRWSEAGGLDPLSGPFLLSAVFLAVTVAVLLLSLRPDPLTLSRQLARARSDAAPAGQASPPARPMRAIFRDEQVLLAVAAMTVGQLVMSLLMVITPVDMHHHEHDTPAISLVIMAHTLGMFGLSWATGWLADRAGRGRTIIAGSALLAIACLIAPGVQGVPGLAVALFLLGLGWNLCFVAGSSMLSNALTTEERGRAQGTAETLVALGSAGGTLGSGLIYVWGQMAAIGAAGIALSVLVAAAALWVSRPGRPATAYAPAQD